MFYHAGAEQSLVVDDGDAVVITAAQAEEMGFRLGILRPVSAAGLLAAAGRTPPNPPRLSDRNHFEYMRSAGELIPLTEVDEQNRVGGYSVAYLTHILEALDPDSPVPTHVELEVRDQDEGCGCEKCKSRGQEPRSRTMQLNRTFVPEIFKDFQVYVGFLQFKDIVVGVGGTLVFDQDVHFLVAGNFLGYRGSRVVQKSTYLNVDVQGRMQGGVQKLVHHVIDGGLHLDLEQLAVLEPTKP